MSLERNGTVSRIREIVLDQVLQKFVRIALFGQRKCHSHMRSSKEQIDLRGDLGANSFALQQENFNHKIKID